MMSATNPGLKQAPPATRQHTWALAIATYNRRDMLITCLELGANQTQPPTEVVVVDASPDWEVARDIVLNELAPKFPDIRWQYVKARRPSPAVQRNQAAELCTADVLFLIDDDSFMYSDTAAQVMKLYDADVNNEVAAVSAVLAPRPPGEAADEQAGQTFEDTCVSGNTRDYSFIARLVRKVLNADDMFVPYDRDYPEKRIPQTLSHLNVGRRILMAGMTMTVRREWVLKARFNEILAIRAEDSDISYRMAQEACIVTALDAKLYHVGTPVGRAPSAAAMALGYLGPVVLHRLHSSDLELSRKRQKKMLRRRLFVELIKDLKNKEWGLPRYKGTRFALKHIDKVLGMSIPEIEAWYPGFQQEVLSGKLLGGKKK